MTKLNKIQNKEELKDYNIVCTDTDEVRKCLDMLEDLSFKVFKNLISEEDRIVRNFSIEDDKIYFSKSDNVSKYLENINFYQFKKVYKRLKKQENKEQEEQERQQKQQLPDFEADDDGRVIKINNWKSRKYVYYMNTIGCNRFIDYKEICKDKEDFFRLEDLIEIGILFDSEENLKKYLFKLEIETKLKNIAHRLNNGVKIDWDNIMQSKFYLGFDYEKYEIIYDQVEEFKDNNIFCLDENFLDEAIKEIGEENLIKYFKGE